MEFQSEDGVSILLRKSKTDQTGTGKWIHLSSETTLAIGDWLQAAGIHKGSCCEVSVLGDKSPNLYVTRGSGEFTSVLLH